MTIGSGTLGLQFGEDLVPQQLRPFSWQAERQSSESGDRWMFESAPSVSLIVDFLL
tara:strand:- start:5 stop:172 length:168 start_codon:yes stop_codon:yes gene_type:complete